MNTPKCNGPDARDDRPAKAHTNFATNFIAAYECASRAGSTFNSEIQTTTQPTSPYVRRQHTTTPDSAARHSCIHLARRDTFRSGAQHTTKQAANILDSDVFSRSKFEDGLSFQGIHGYGAGSVYPQGRQHNLFCVLKPSSTLCPQQADGGLSVQQGTKTMTTAAFQGNTPVQSTTAISRHQAIENALSMALFHIRKGDTQQDIHSAMAKARRAASLLKQACTEVALIGGAA